MPVDKERSRITCLFATTCCMKCNERKLGCHATCQTYKKEKEECESKRTWLKEKNSGTLGAKTFAKYIPNKLEGQVRKYK